LAAGSCRARPRPATAAGVAAAPHSALGAGKRVACGATTRRLGAGTIHRSMPSPEEFVAYCGLALIQGILVLLPRPAASARWGRLRSPAWVLVLPVSLMIGTFGVLDVPHGATGLGVLAALATPVFVVLAVLGVGVPVGPPMGSPEDGTA
jgi:hypothetical protein